MSAKICILGDNACANRIAETLLEADVEVILAAGEAGQPSSAGARNQAAQAAEILSGARLVHCRGEAGNFVLDFVQNGRRFQRTAAGIVLAEAGERKPLFDLYGLKSSECVVPLSQLLEQAAAPSHAAAPVEQVVFLDGIQAESHPLISGQIMGAALRLQVQHGAQATILTRHLKVAGAGLEALSREARAAGVLFFKFTQTTPAIRQDSGGRAHLTFTDEPTGENWVLSPDRLVVDEDWGPSAYAVELGRILQIESDGAGFQQADNVHRQTVSTNRRGIMVAGDCRAPGLNPFTEADNAALEAFSHLHTAVPRPAASAEIEPGRCIRCLTCLRVCPYRAVSLNTRPAISAEACETCGICAAECPREAIRIPGLERHELLGRVAAGRPADDTNRPYIAAFCCRRSAGIAARAALCEQRGREATINVIEVPCAGTIAPQLMLSALSQGADGVLVLACHEDNCHSHRGNRLAGMRAEQVSAFLKANGTLEHRLMFKTLAANMVKEFIDIAAEFGSTLRGLSNRKLD